MAHQTNTEKIGQSITPPIDRVDPFGWDNIPDVQRDDMPGLTKLPRTTGFAQAELARAQARKTEGARHAAMPHERRQFGRAILKFFKPSSPRH